VESGPRLIHEIHEFHQPLINSSIEMREKSESTIDRMVLHATFPPDLMISFVYMSGWNPTGTYFATRLPSPIAVDRFQLGNLMLVMSASCLSRKDKKYLLFALKILGAGMTSQLIPPVRNSVETGFTNSNNHLHENKTVQKAYFPH
jgi:hypothetical protein